MVAISMHSTNSLITKLQNKYPSLRIIKGTQFMWNPIKDEITYSTDGDINLLFHEVGHALLAHTSYKSDIELVTMEQAAWKRAKELANDLGFLIDNDVAQQHLDTYRTWLHHRSTCPICELNGLQISEDTYQCLNCHSKWSTNEARSCGLKRHLL